MSAQPVVVPSREAAATPVPGHLFVSTALDTWLTKHASAFAHDVQIDDIAYRRLDPEYYAWLRSRMMLAKTAASAGQIGLDVFDELRHRFNAIHQWAVDHFGEQTLIAAARGVGHCEYHPPIAEAEPQHATVPACPDRNTVLVSSESAALVNTIRDCALALGWTHESLHQMRGSIRFPLGSDYGLVCYLKPCDRIGEVTTHSIEIILPNNMRQRFYNPNVDQPWIRRVSREEA